jgi:DNA-binding transcriptional LysR family regulator
MNARQFAEVNAFATIVEHGGFGRAAAHLRVSPSALSQTMRKLEERLGVRLLNRTTRSLAPTDAGARLLERLGPLLSELDAAVVEAQDAARAPAGTLRINAPRLAALSFLGPLVGRFLAAHPGMTLDLVVEDALTDIVAGCFDAGVRLGERLQRDMVAVPLCGALEMMAVASTRYLARHGRPETPRDLQHHRCINWRLPSTGGVYRWEFERGKRVLEVAVEGPLVVNDADLAVRAALDGVGIAYLIDLHVAALVRSGKLERVLAPWSPSFPGFYLYYPSRRQMPPVLRAFVDFVRASHPEVPRPALPRRWRDGAGSHSVGGRPAPGAQAKGGAS